MTFFKWPVVGLAAAIYCAGALPSAAQSIQPCSQSSDRTERSRTSQAGIDCRQRNIDTYVNAISVLQPVQGAALKRCLQALGRELQGDNGSSGAGPKYFAKVKQCQDVARGAGDSLPAANLDSATADMPAGDACDQACVTRAIGDFMKQHPEP
jgi:hypothetical protein